MNRKLLNFKWHLDHVHKASFSTSNLSFFFYIAKFNIPNFVCFDLQIEQLHKIFKLCGSPTEEYWKKVKPPTTFRPPQHKPCFEQFFPNLPYSAFPLLYTLLSIEPHLRGTAATALQNEVSLASFDWVRYSIGWKSFH